MHEPTFCYFGRVAQSGGAGGTRRGSGQGCLCLSLCQWMARCGMEEESRVRQEGLRDRLQSLKVDMLPSGD